MAALTAPRQTLSRSTFYFEDEVDVKANAILFNGALAATDATGYLVAGTVSTALLRPCVVECNGYGRVYDNTGGANGAKRAKVRFGIFRFNNSSAGDLIVKASVGLACYIVDDNTVALTNGSSTRSQAGIVVDVDTSGVWVRLAP